MSETAKTAMFDAGFFQWTLTEEVASVAGDAEMCRSLGIDRTVHRCSWELDFDAFESTG